MPGNKQLLTGNIIGEIVLLAEGQSYVCTSLTYTMTMNNIPAATVTVGAGTPLAVSKAGSAYKSPEELLKKIQARFVAYCCDDAETKAAIAGVWQEHGYLCDTHTAVARRASRLFGTGDGPVVILSTASPYKFPAAVLSALGVPCGDDEFAMMDALEAATLVPMPENLRGLRKRPVLHRDVVAPADMLSYVKAKKAEPSWA